MSQWQTRGFVPDSDEDDDLDISDNSSPKQLRTHPAAAGNAEALTAVPRDAPPPNSDALDALSGSQDELALDNSQNRLRPRPSSYSHGTNGEPSSSLGAIPLPAYENPSRPGTQERHHPETSDPRIPLLSAAIANLGHPSSEIPIESAPSVVPKVPLATQLFTDDPTPSTPERNGRRHSSRPVTPIGQDDDLDELQQQSPFVRNGSASTGSSPLSEARSDISQPLALRSSPPLGPALWEFEQQTNALNQGTSRPLVQVVIPRPGQATLLQEEPDYLETERETRIRRALRQRTSIQLHPYLIDEQKYRQSFQARGLKPERVTSGHHKNHERHHGKHNDESQYLDSQDKDFVADHTQSSDVPQSSQADVPSSPPRPAMTATAPDDLVQSESLNDAGSDHDRDNDDDDDDLPDLGYLLQKTHKNEPQHKPKRRKAALTYSRNENVHRATAVPQTAPRSTLSLNRENAGLFGVPPSPPTSETQPALAQSLVRTGNFHDLAAHFSPLQQLHPPTPDMSSTRKPRQEHLTHSEPEDDSPPLGTARRNGMRRTTSIRVVHSGTEDESHDERGSAAADNESVDNSKERELQRAKRRIKGVLPASWLTLGLDQQKRAHKKFTPGATDRNGKASSASTRAGTAEAVGTSGRQSPTTSREGDEHQNAVLIDDDDGDEDRSEAEAQSEIAAPPERNREETMHAELDDGFARLAPYEVREHDWIDPMLPSGSRPRSGEKSKRKRQTRLTDAVPSALKRPRLDSFDRPRPNVTISHQSSARKASGTKGQSRPRRVPKRPTPRLSILDAPDLNHSASQHVPQFLKLAARQVRRQPDKGRHSPKNKYIRLQTEADTEDANAVLREWRAGTIALPAEYDEGAVPTATRPPLSDRTANQQRRLHQQRLPEPEKVMPEAQRVGESTASQSGSRSRGMRPKMRQIKLNPIALSRNTSPTPSSRAKKPRLAVHIARRPASQKPKVKQPTYRTAQLERVENDYDAHGGSAAFQRKLSSLNREFEAQFRRTWNGQARNPQLDRFFLEDEDEVASLSIPQTQRKDVLSDVEREPQPTLSKPKRKSKARVQRVDVETRAYRQPNDPPPIQVDSTPPPVEHEHVEPVVLEGLGLYGIGYTTDFDVSPLWTGTFFHESTMMGNGDLQRALHVGRRDLDAPFGLSTFRHDGTVFKWGAWTEEVASEMESLVSSAVSRLESSQRTFHNEASEDPISASLADYLCLMRNVIQYISTNMHFLDPIDRHSFVLRVQNLIESATANLLADILNLSTNPFHGHTPETMKIRLLLLLAILAHQTVQIAGHSQVDLSTRKSMERLLKTLLQPLMRLILRKGMAEIRGYIDENRRHAAREQGIREDKLAIESLVTIHHILNSLQLPQWSFWDAVREELTPSIARTCHLQSFERLWYDIFALLPYLEIDTTGLLKTNRRFQTSQGDWTVVVPLLSHLLKLYPQTSQRNGKSLNAYVRSCLIRCYNLVQFWGWKKCDQLLMALFDFFSHRSFANLEHEESKGSPHFLEQLDQNPSVEIQPGDRAFHVFLKTLVIGFKSLRHLSDERSLLNLTWRLTPNHRRQYNKEEGLRQEDLDGLRNQHDFFCTLYWVSPPKVRPPLMPLRNWVDQALSHREVCRLSVRAWSSIARYQISTDEGKEALSDLSDWFKDIITQNLTQHRLARSEAENEAAKRPVDDLITPEHLQLVIKNNQAQILATLGDAVSGMKAVMTAAHNPEDATTFLQTSAISDVFKLFDSKNLQVSKLIVEVLEVFQKYLKFLEREDTRVESQQTSEESQDYGEWPELDDDEPSELRNQTTPAISLDFLHDAAWQLVSSCFGAHPRPDEKLLTTVVDTWTSIASRLVQKGQKSWDNFLDSYNAHSWHQLQDTWHTRQFGAYFMSAVLERDPRVYEDHKDELFMAWVLSLVERDFMLMFQHRLTSCLLNRDPGHPLLKNLPFVKDPRTGLFNITLREFRDRRLNLISSLLSNMREAYDAAMRDHKDRPALRREYTELLKQLMGAMKKNYLELNQDPNGNGKSAYVGFVQTVVEFLQQHAFEICPVDRFFTDSTAFPLPATDPTYVAGRLKGYAPKLSEQGTIKKLVFFIQSVSERAAVDNEQAYLVSQLGAATLGAFECGSICRPSLRQVLLRAIFPAYVELTFKTSCGWILSKPIIQASCAILHGLQHQYSISNPESLVAAKSILGSMLSAMHGAIELLITHEGLLEQPHVLHVLASVFTAVAATIPTVTYIHRCTKGHVAAALVHYIEAFKAFSLFAASKVLASGNDDAFFSPYPADMDLLDGEPDEDQRFKDIRHMCATQLSQTLGASGGRSSWIKQGERRYYLDRNNSRRAINIDAVGSLEQEQSRVIHAIEEFHGVLGAVLWRGEEDLVERRKNAKRSGWPRGPIVV